MAELVKHYLGTMKGIPQLTNAWGAMITLLDAVLVNGFNHVPILTLTKSSQTAITATINLGSGHGFIDRQVIRIAGSTNGWDGDYKVLSANTDSVVIECLATHPAVVTGTVSCSTAPLGFEIVFSTPAGSAKPKRAYRSTNPESLGLILLVHDFCVSGANATGAKFAKVGIISNMTNIDTIVGDQMPFNSSNPDANWGWDGTYHGWAKWYYAMPGYVDNYDQRADSAAPGTYNRAFRYVGDSTSFIINIEDIVASGMLMCSAIYGIAEFEDAALKNNNLLLMASNIRGNKPQNTAYFATERIGYASYISNEQHQDGVLWYDSVGLVSQQKAGPVYYLSMGGVVSEAATATATPIFIEYPIIDSSYRFRGVAPFLRLNMAKNNQQVLITDDGKVACRYHTYRATAWWGLNLESR